jgi:hypothetical protein
MQANQKSSMPTLLSNPSSDVPATEKHTWSGFQSLTVGPDTSVCNGKVHCFDSPDVRSVGKAVDRLNDGWLSCPEGCCAVYSERQKLCSILYRSDKKEFADALLASIKGLKSTILEPIREKEATYPPTGEYNFPREEHGEKAAISLHRIAPHTRDEEDPLGGLSEEMAALKKQAAERRSAAEARLSAARESAFQKSIATASADNIAADRLSAARKAALQKCIAVSKLQKNAMHAAADIDSVASQNSVTLLPSSNNSASARKTEKNEAKKAYVRSRTQMLSAKSRAFT